MKRLPSLSLCVAFAALISGLAVNRTQAQAAPAAAPHAGTGAEAREPSFR